MTQQTPEATKPKFDLTPKSVGTATIPETKAGRTSQYENTVFTKPFTTLAETYTAERKTSDGAYTYVYPTNTKHDRDVSEAVENVMRKTALKVAPKLTLRIDKSLDSAAKTVTFTVWFVDKIKRPRTTTADGLRSTDAPAAAPADAPATS